MLRPIGREPSATYWRRRALLLVAVLVMLFAVSRACADDASGEDGALRRATGKSISGPTEEPTPSQPGTEEPGGTDEPTDGPTGPDGGTGAPTDEPTDGSVSGGGVVPGYCQDANVRISVRSTKSTFQPGEDVTFTLTILNIGDGPCRFEVGPKGWELTVQSGPTRIWNTDDCAVSEESILRTLQPVDPYTATVTWDRVRSKPDCPPDQPTASPGTYTVLAHAGAVASQKAIFVLAD